MKEDLRRERPLRSPVRERRMESRSRRSRPAPLAELAQWHSCHAARASPVAVARRARASHGRAYFSRIGARALELTRDFSARLASVHELLQSDVRAAFEGDPAARSLEEALFCYPGVTAILHHRLAHELYRLGLPLLARIIAEIAHGATGIDTHPGAEIGQSFFIDHGTGVVIGETAVVGERVRLYQGVTLGAKRITIGHGSSIGGNVWLTRSVPPLSRVTQAQARSEVFSDRGGI
jgi:serine O-acetyltransferase